MSSPLTISALTAHIKGLFEQDDLLRDVAVMGEVSNWKRAASGHIYFSLKDSGAALSAVMWRTAAVAHTWLPREGDQIVAHGYVSVYPERGTYQIIVNRIVPAGRGQLYAQFESLKARLAAEGLFDPARKRPIPIAARRIGIVTSRDAAALRDILRVMAARWPLAEVVVFPTLVQGSEAAGQIAEMIRTANRYSATVAPLDVLIVARGGGSIEDLWAFNDERVAYALATSELPTVAGIGHETDFTIADFVADLRAPTPSAAAAAVTPDRAEQRERLIAHVGWMAGRVGTLIQAERRQLRGALRQMTRLHPARLLDVRRQQLDDRARRLQWTARRRLDRLHDHAAAAAQRLEALSPTRVLQRGYSIVARAAGTVVTGPAGLGVGEPLRVRGAGGSYGVKVVELPMDGDRP